MNAPIFDQAWGGEEGIRRVNKLYEDTFNSTPTGVWSAPGRVNIIGEHTDYNDGLALPIALPHRTFVALGTRADRKLKLISRQENGIREVGLDRVGPKGTDTEVKGWPAYVAGVLWALEQDGYGPLPGLNIAVDSCVPFGAGLSSSAALECAIAVGIDDLADLHLAGQAETPNDEGRKILAKVCVQAENQIAGAPTGGMDQAASLRCARGHAIKLDCRSGHVSQVPFDLAQVGLELLVIDTRAPHALVDGQYADRRTTCEAAAASLGVKALVDVEDLPQALTALKDPTQVKRTRHVVTEIERTRLLVELLDRGPLAGEILKKVGMLLDASHESLRCDYQVTCPELDVAVDAARAAGAFGARMTGGGFGGSAIALIGVGQAKAVAGAVAQAFSSAGFNEPHFLVATAGAPAGRN